MSPQNSSPLGTEVISSWVLYGEENLPTHKPSNFEDKPRGLYSSGALFEGLIFGGAYLRKEICASKSIGLAL